ncbi:hypothetical protein GGR55DRAFT_685112 [Xylaria sp. FL0064]|nr:hypothetical protein GGR55DRAFT_685112 [Xylaria sp. FL0064]
MVGLVERFRKPKLPVALGSPPRDGVVHQQVLSRPPIVTPPVLRNFSYPTNVTNNSPLPSTPVVAQEPPSTWDQLGEICNFSSSTTPRIRQDRTAGLEDPFFYTTDRTPYKRLVDTDDRIDRIDKNTDARQSTDSVRWIHRTAVETRRRRSTLLGLPSSQGGPKDKGTHISNSQSIGDHIFSQKYCNITTRLKRSSLGHHKTSSSFDASRLLAQRPSSLERPMSSSGVPLIDTKRTHSASTTTNFRASPPLFAREAIEEYSTNPDKIALVSYTLSGSYTMGTDARNSRSSSQDVQQVAPDSQRLSEERQYGSRASESQKRKGKEGKIRWFSQLKEWVSVSEPSTQALKNYKKDTYNKAGIALDDPLANAKLHLPVAPLPPDAIKPGGRGPEPEEIIFQKAMQRRQARGLLPLMGTSQGSRSSASHRSSPSSDTLSALKDGD